MDARSLAARLPSRGPAGSQGRKGQTDQGAKNAQQRRLRAFRQALIRAVEPSHQAFLQELQQQQALQQRPQQQQQQQQPEQSLQQQQQQQQQPGDVSTSEYTDGMCNTLPDQTVVEVQQEGTLEEVVACILSFVIHPPAGQWASYACTLLDVCTVPSCNEKKHSIASSAACMHAFSMMCDAASSSRIQVCNHPCLVGPHTAHDNLLSPL